MAMLGIIMTRMANAYRLFIYVLGMGPIMGRWNLFLEKNFPLRAIGRGSRSAGPSGTEKVDLKALGKRVLVDQTFMCVIIILYSVPSVANLESFLFSFACAGRRLGYVAFVLEYALRSTHDSIRYNSLQYS